MYGTLCIFEKSTNQLESHDTNNFYGMYDRLTELGFEHEEAEDIACWAENAPDGAEYYSSKEETYQIFIWCE